MSAFREVMPDASAPYCGCVTPGSWLAQRLDAIRTKRQRWNSYFRACRRIPKGTPCYRVTSWRRINERRCYLIGRDVADGHREFEALQNVAHEIGCGPLVAHNFCLGRWLRRARKAGFAS